MPLRLDQVHDYESGEGMQAVLKSINTAVRIRWSRGHPPIYVQNGGYYGEGGDVIDPATLPQEFWDKAQRMSQQARTACGLVLPDEKPPKKQAAKPVQWAETDMNLCPVCHKGIVKGVVWAKHVKDHRQKGEWTDQ